MRLDTERMRAEADAELEAAQLKHREKVRAIDEIERLARNGQATAPKPSPRKPAAAPAPSASARPVKLSDGLAPVVVNAVSERPEGATLQSVADYISRMYPNRNVKRLQIARVMYKMNKRGQLRITRKQSGNIPALYAVAHKNEPN